MGVSTMRDAARRGGSWRWMLALAAVALLLALAPGVAGSSSSSSSSPPPPTPAPLPATAAAAAASSTDTKQANSTDLFDGLPCPPLAAPQYGSLRVDDALRPGLVWFRCALGFELRGSQTSKCRRSGQWTHPVPQCVSMGLRAYPSSTALASAGLLSIHDDAVVTGLMDAAQKARNAVGFVLRVKGTHKAWLLRQHESLEELIPSEAHTAYLFTRDGRLKRYPGYRAHKKVTMQAIEFATNPSVLKGLKNAAAAKHQKNNNIIGFTIAKGTEFRASLLGWEGLPLQPSKTRHAFTLREEVEQNIKEVGCFRVPANGQSLFAARAALSEEVSIRTARIVCAGLAREKNHRYFAVSERFCYSGSNAPFGTSEVVNSAAASRASCALTPERALSLNLTTSNSNAVIGAGAAKGFLHTFQIEQKLLVAPDLMNGGFEAQQLLAPIYPRPAGTNTPDRPPVTGKQSVAFDNSTQLQHWHVRSRHGEVGLATYGSAQLVNQTVPEGINVLYMMNEGSITQQLSGLEMGKRYTLRFSETFRRDQRAGLALTVRLGSHFTIYHNPFVSTPLWSKRQIDFTAPARNVNITFRVEESHEKEKGGIKTADSTILLDQIRISRKGFSSVKVGFVGAKAHGRVATLNATHPAIASAFLKMTQHQAKLGNGGVGFRLQDGIPSAIGRNDLKTLKASPGSRIYLNNGTVIRDHTTKQHSGMLSVRHAWVLKAIARVAEQFANSVAFSVHQNVRQGVQVIVLSPSALPLIPDDNYITYFFTPHIDDLGCWSVPKGGRVLKTLHPLPREPASRAACAEAASRLDHEFFALQEGGQCVSGRSDPTDRSDDLFWEAGRSSRCDTLCTNGQDNCGGKGAATVFRLMPYTLVSKNGQASVDPLDLPREQRTLAQNVFDEPGMHYFSTVSEEDLKEARDHADLKSLSNSTQLSWAHPLQYHFGGSQTYAIAKYVIQAPALTKHHPATPSDWTFEGSNDGFNWTVLDRQSHVAFYTGQRRAFVLRNTRRFHFHRLLVTENGGLGVPGFGVQGVSLYARTDKVRFLRALYRFENNDKVGWDSSIKNNDLEVFGAAANQTANNATNTVFGITRRPVDVKHGKGALRISNPAGSMPSWLALDNDASLPAGIPADSGSFSIAFWFHADSERDHDWRFAGQSSKPKRFTILSWGSSKEEVSLNSISIDSDFLSITNSFGRGDNAPLRTPISRRSHGLLNNWHHYAVSYDSVSGEHRVWLDSKLAASRIYRNPKFSVAPKHFRIGARRLPTESNPVGDEFNGLLDDIAIFRGPLTHASVREIARGRFRSYLPMSCQDISDRYWVEAGVTWGEASPSAKERFMRNKCYTKAMSCQMLSDLYGMTPLSTGKAGFYARKQYQRQKCATWPSILTRADTAASCAPGSSTTVHNVRSRRAALELCSKAGHRCQSYQYGGASGNEKLGIKPFQLDMCATYLSDLRLSLGTQITTRISKYLLHPDSKIKCDSQSLPTHSNVPSSIHARWLCDSTPGCVAYVWSGPKGKQPGGHADTPNRATLCASIRKGKIFNYPGSGHEVGEKLGSYVVLPERFAPCSEYSMLAAISNVTSSLHARRECDRLDGTGDLPKCQSYSWDRANGVAKLCSSVPQSPVQFAEDVELGLVTPSSCQDMSNSYHIRYGQSWGFAPFEVKAMFHTHNCATSPLSCQELSDQYRLSPNITAKIASKVPGVIRDLWLRQGCITQPQKTASHFLLSSTLSELQQQIDRVKAQIDHLNRRLFEIDASSLLGSDMQNALAAELHKARQVLQAQLDDLSARQQRELQPMLDRAAKSPPTVAHTQAIHDIAEGLFQAATART